MRIEQLTFLRFVAASIVIIFHVGRNATGFSGALTSGPEMVTFFFVLSGFVMGIAYYNKDIKITKYLWARISRIAPVYMLALALFVIGEFIRNREVNTLSLILNLILMQSWFPSHTLSLNSPGWSLSVEAFFYISFPFILYYIKKYSASSIHIALCAFLLWTITNIVTTVVFNNYYDDSSISHYLLFYFPITHLCSFLLGLSGAVLILEKKIKNNNESFISFILLISILLIALILINKDYISNFFDLKLPFASSLLSPLFIILIVMMALSRSILTNILSFYPLVLLGEASYSMYILQIPMYSIYCKYLSNSLSLSDSVNFFVYFTFLIFVSVLTFLTFEKPVNKFLRNYFPDFLHNQLINAPTGRE